MHYEFAVNMTGKNCLITGATSGHGRAVARALAAQGAHCIIHGRNEAKLERTSYEIYRETGNRPETLVANFSSLADVRRSTGVFLKRGIELDLLVNNAGLVNQGMKLSAEGYEEVFAVNYLAMQAFTLGLLPAMKKKSSRIVIVASDAHYIGKLNLDDLDNKSGYSLMGSYGSSKLAVVYFSLELARRLGETGITVNAVDPGPIASGIAKKPSLIAKIADAIIQLTFPSAEKAARSCLYLCMSPEVSGKTGGYFRFMKFKDPKISDDPEFGKKLWQKTVAMTGIDYQG